MITTSVVCRPFFPASFHNVGTVPAIHPTKNQRMVVSYAPSKKLTKNESKKTPVTPPSPTGKKNQTFSLKFFVMWAKKEINRSYIPKTAANAPPLTPGKINPEPINIPLIKRKSQSFDPFLVTFSVASCLFSTYISTPSFLIIQYLELFPYFFI